mmetsp:Transcript_8789/g.19192  ORF Transcript_8789/g.19192 Transcript_8789/m.19192 type:complete len:336 (-) Transcript_8789:361-1368(-)
MCTTMHALCSTVLFGGGVVAETVWSQHARSSHRQTEPTWSRQRRRRLHLRLEPKCRLLGHAIHAFADGEVGATHEEVRRLVGVNVSPQLLGVGLGSGLGRLDRLHHLLLHAHLDLLDLRSRAELCLKDIPLRALDGVPGRAHARNLVAVAVRDPRVGHRVAVVPVRVHLDDHRAVLGHVLPDELDTLAHRKHVHAVDLDPRHVVAARVVVVARRRALLGRAHAVLVVLAHVDQRQLPERRHVERLEELPLVGRAIAIQGPRHTAIALVLVCKGEAGTNRTLGANDAIAAVEVGVRLIHMHRAALALGTAAFLAKELSEHTRHRVASEELLAVVSV